MSKDWRTSSPKWAVEAASAEMAAMKRTLALRWPTEAKPVAKFGFGGYDKEWGTVQLGTFYNVNGRGVEKIIIREKTETEHGWKKLRFSPDGREWTDSVYRGHYFETEKEACLFNLWERCEQFARELEQYWERLENSSDKIGGTA